MSHLFSRYYQAILVLLLFSSAPLLEIDFINTQKAFAECNPVLEDCEEPLQNTNNGSAGGGGDSGAENNREITTDSTLGKAQAALTAQEMRGYQSLYEMQAELFAECVAKLKSWDGTLTKPADGWPDGAETDLDKICAEEFTDMNKQGVDRLLIPDATREQVNQEELKDIWWDLVLEYWFGIYDEDGTSDGRLIPPLKQTYTETLRSVTAPAADPENAELKKALENWYGAANSLGGSEFLWHYLVTKNQLHAVPFQQGIVTISNCPNLSSPIFANQDCVKTEWDKRIEQLDNQRLKLIQEIEKQLKAETGGNSDEDTITNAKDLIAWYAVDDTDMLEAYDLKEIDANRNALQLDIQKLSFLVSLLEQLAKYSATVAYQLELKDSSGGMGIYGNFSTTNAGVDIAQITNLSGKENMTLSQTISKLSNTMVIIGLAIMIPIIVYAGFLMVLSGYDYEQYEKGNEMLWKVLPWAVFLCACRLLVAAWLHVLSEAFRPIASF